MALVFALCIYCLSLYSPNSLPIVARPLPTHYASSNKHLKSQLKVLTTGSLDDCYSATNVSTNMTRARDYYNSYMETFRKIMPGKFKSGYASPCWDAQFEAELISPKQVLATVNGATHCISDYRKVIAYFKMNAFQTGGEKFTSNLLCMPSVFVIGFSKCGTTFLWCLVNHILYRDSSKYTTRKEITWWVRGDRHLDYPERTSEDICQYITHYIYGNDQIAHKNATNALLFDGGPNVMFWPWHNENDDPFANFCLLPTAMPRLIPGAEFIVTMRNPVEMVYSECMFSCQGSSDKPSEMPRSFHKKNKSLFL